MDKYIKITELKHTITEQMEPELPDYILERYDDLFILQDHYSSLINNENFKDLRKEINNVMRDVEDGYGALDIAQDYGFQYDPDTDRKLKSLEVLSFYDRIARYLEIKTGEPYSTKTVRGYCQSDWATVIFPRDIYRDKDIDVLGDYCFGCFKEFSITDPDGEEVFGYIVADSELSSYSDKAYKEVVCAMEGIDPEHTLLKMIEEVKTIRQPVYRTA